ncbi:NAD(P)-dependent oxidoreductase [Humitalea sp. 24SJ18S-53]|uniref:NAD(P)-dependent oxidoreductase n=1 Tax=Humitalea sp. 24SJ18S-53 TaxID=3422307 RepID=UPI003D668391
MRACFIDAGDGLADVLTRLRRADDPPITLNDAADVAHDALPGLLAGHEIAIIDHTTLPTDVAKRCAGLKHVVFLGTGARSYMNPEELAAECGIEVHIIKGYGDTAVAEMAFALMWAAAKGLARMDGAMRRGEWLRTEGVELTGKTVGLLGFGGIAADMARLCQGAGMRVIAWNRTPKSHPGVTFVPLETLLAESKVLSIHLLLNDDTQGLLSRARLAAMQPGAILINTARGAVVDEAALAEALESGHLSHAGLDVFGVEPLPAGHPFTQLPNTTLAAHSGFRTAEATDKLLLAALDHCRRIAAG